MIYENKSIGTYSLGVAMLGLYVEKRKEEEKSKKEKEEKENSYVHYLLKQQFFAKCPDFIDKCF